MRKEELERWDEAELLRYKDTLKHRIAGSKSAMQNSEP